MINTTIDKYKIIRLIGEGGMASVYEAEHEMLGTKAAIKVLNPILSANAQIKERFRNEAKLMASLDHPNITKVIDFDEQPQQLSILMEFLNGEDLKQKIKRNGALNEKEITDIFSQTLSAFQYAHEKGIVHRDIKPSNIFILPNGHVKILDFGIAKLFGQGNEMTQTGTQMGTPIYMSPEQVKADKSRDHRSDIYSLGVTMFYAINGKPPYNSETDSQFDIFIKIVYEVLPKFSIQSKFRDVVIKACQKNREERFQTCLEYLQALNLPSINPLESNEKTIIDEKIAYNTKEEKTIIKDLGTKYIDRDQNMNHEPQTSLKPKQNKKLSVAFGRGLGLIVIIILLSLVVRNNRDKELADDTTGTIPKTDTQGSMARKDSMNMALVMNLKGAIGDLSDGDINIKVEKGVVYVDISDKLLFKSGSFSITDKATVVLGKVAKVLSGQPNIELMVEGVKPNFIVRLLEEKYGIDPKRMTAAGRGEYVPVAENNSAENRAILLFTFRE